MEEKINFQECFNKEDAIRICEELGTTVRKECVEKFDKIINALIDCRNKLDSGERLENKDFTKAAVPLRSMMHAIMNAWYMEED